MKYAKQRTPTRYATQLFSPVDGLDWSIKILRDGRWECSENHISSGDIPEITLTAEFEPYSRKNIDGVSCGFISDYKSHPASKYKQTFVEPAAPYPENG